MGVKIRVKVQPGAKEYGAKYSEGIYIIKVKKPPIEGQANEDLLSFISEKLGVNRSSVRILSGFHSKLKVIEILENLKEEEIQRRLL